MFRKTGLLYSKRYKHLWMYILPNYTFYNKHKCYLIWIKDTENIAESGLAECLNRSDVSSNTVIYLNYNMYLNNKII